MVRLFRMYRLTPRLGSDTSSNPIVPNVASEFPGTTSRCSLNSEPDGSVDRMRLFEGDLPSSDTAIHKTRLLWSGGVAAVAGLALGIVAGTLDVTSDSASLLAGLTVAAAATILAPLPKLFPRLRTRQIVFALVLIAMFVNLFAALEVTAGNGVTSDCSDPRAVCATRGTATALTTVPIAFAILASLLYFPTYRPKRASSSAAAQTLILQNNSLRDFLERNQVFLSVGTDYFVAEGMRLSNRPELRKQLSEHLRSAGLETAIRESQSLKGFLIREDDFPIAELTNSKPINILKVLIRKERAYYVMYNSLEEN